MYKMPYSEVKGEVSVALRGCLFSYGAWGAMRAMARRLEFGNNVLAAGVPGEPGSRAGVIVCQPAHLL